MPLGGSGILRDPPEQLSTLSAGPKRDHSGVAEGGPFEFCNCTACKVVIYGNLPGGASGGIQIFEALSWLTLDCRSGLESR